MYHIFLDAGGAGLLYYGLVLLLIFLVAAILIEAVVMILLKYNLGKKAFGDSALVNLTSVIVGLIGLALNIDELNLKGWGGYAAYFTATIAVEGIILYLLNKTKPWLRTILICILMNIITYALLFLIGEIY